MGGSDVVDGGEFFWVVLVTRSVVVVAATVVAVVVVAPVVAVVVATAGAVATFVEAAGSVGAAPSPHAANKTPAMMAATLRAWCLRHGIDSPFDSPARPSSDQMEVLTSGVAFRSVFLRRSVADFGLLDESG